MGEDKNVCPAHSGMEQYQKNDKYWKERHLMDHDTINKKLDRLPTWATLALAFLTGVIGYLW